MRAAGAGLTAIANALNADGVWTQRRGRWWPGTVRYILDNPKYRGQVEYLFTWSGQEKHVLRDGVHEPLLS